MTMLDGNDVQGTSGRGLSRRHLLGTAAIAAVGATALGGPAVAGAHDGDRRRGRRGDDGQIPRSRRVSMLYTVQDLLANDPATYPTLPAGYRKVFKALAEIGYSGVEFFSFTGAPSFNQHANADGGASLTPTQVRGFLDEFGLKAAGHYNAGVTPPASVSGLTPATIDAALSSAQILGQTMTGSHDATLSLRQKADVDAVIDTWNSMAVKAKAAGLPIYSHTHNDPWNFLLDSGPKDASGNYTRSSGIRVMEYFLQHTDRRWIKLEMDVFWAYVAQFQFKTYTAPDGSTRSDVFDPAAMAGKYASRCAIFHAKDGVSAPADAKGLIFAPFGFGDIDFDRFFAISRAGRTNPYWSSEQDNAPGGAADPQKSLRDAAHSYQGLATLGTRDEVGAPFAGNNTVH